MNNSKESVNRFQYIRGMVNEQNIRLWDGATNEEEENLIKYRRACL